MPDVSSPFVLHDSIETVLVRLKNGKFALMNVTVENGEPLLYSRKIGSTYGKDQQLYVDSGDFPTLAKTGLHVDSALDQMTTMTGMSVSVINYIGRPGRYSGAGFMAEDEDIISVLKADNGIVKKLDLTHPQMAKPLFHIWNIILTEKKLGNLGRFCDNIKKIFYNQKTIDFRAESYKGWQASIFQDEIQGRFEIEVRCALSPGEKSFLKEKYPHLSAEQMKEMENKLSIINVSEMAPYYIMRYGFYEGHTDYRSDPLAIAFIFGLKRLEEIEDAFAGKLYDTLLTHFNQN
jgi:hypothetical protein